MPATPSGIRGATITGWGTALPPKVLTNKDLEGMFDTSDEWITERTGIRERRVGGTTTGLSIESGRKALEMSGVPLDQVDAVVLATTTPRSCSPTDPAQSCCRAVRATGSCSDGISTRTAHPSASSTRRSVASS